MKAFDKATLSPSSLPSIDTFEEVHCVLGLDKSDLQHRLNVRGAFTSLKRSAPSVQDVIVRLARLKLVDDTVVFAEGTEFAGRRVLVACVAIYAVVVAAISIFCGRRGARGVVSAATVLDHIGRFGFAVGGRGTGTWGALRLADVARRRSEHLR